MSILKNIVPTGILTRTKREVSSNVWEKCTGCGEMLYVHDLADNLRMCPKCGHHLRISLGARFDYLLDKNTLEEVAVPHTHDDPIKFRDSKRYSDRLRASRKKTGQHDAARVVKAQIDGVECVVAAFDFAFMGGSMGQQVGQALVTAANVAVKEKKPLLVIPASGGARMQEGILSLMQMARSTAAIQELKEAKLPYVVLLTDPTTGGVTASFAMIGDVTMAEPGALIGFAGPRVIQQTIGETLPDGFQTAEYLYDNGMVDMITPRPEQAEKLGTIFRILMKKKHPAKAQKI